MGRRLLMELYLMRDRFSEPIIASSKGLLIGEIKCIRVFILLERRNLTVREECLIIFALCHYDKNSERMRLNNSFFLILGLI